MQWGFGEMRFGLLIIFVLAFSSEAAAALNEWFLHSPRAVQEALTAKGFNLGPVDGKWGKKSISALKAFQKENGLPVSGIFDGATNEVLFPLAKELPLEPAVENTKPLVKTETKDVDPPVKVIVEDFSTALVPAKTPLPKQAITAVEKKVELSVEVPDIPVVKGVATGTSGGLVYGAIGLVVAGVVAFSLLMRKTHQASIDVLNTGESLQHHTVEKETRTPSQSAETDDLFQSLFDNETVLADLHAGLSVQGGKVADKASRSDQPVSSTAVVGPEAGLPKVGDQGFRVSLAKHNREVAVFVANNRLSDDNVEIEAGKIAVPVTAILLQDDATANSDFRKPDVGNLQRMHTAGVLTKTANVGVVRNTDAGWIAPGTPVSVSGVSISGGFIYFGAYLPKQGTSNEAENCLINPKLIVSPNGDPYGSTMGYWPSYTRISPEARRSYLHWLAGKRDDADAYIGFVFLYFYGLERRLMLDTDQSDASDVVVEVRRLLAVYGHNGSFHRYANELLSAYQFKANPMADGTALDTEGNGYEVPMSIKMALGARVRDGKPIEPDLLMKYAMSHPETRVRTPARRAPELLTELFAQELETRYPAGLAVKGGRFKSLKVNYRACSGSFTIDVEASGGSIPDITGRAEPIATARSIFENCSAMLDEYSRILGRSPGLQPTLAAIAKLPLLLRHKAGQRLAGNPLASLEALASTSASITLGDLIATLGLDVGNAIGKTKLKEISQLLAAFGYGNTADPAYAVRLAGKIDPVVLFRISDADASLLEPSQSYRSVQLSVMLGLVIGHVDGDLCAAEKDSLHARIEKAPGITDGERIRLRAEMMLSDLDTEKLEEWTKRLKDVPQDGRSGLAAELVEIAAADGVLHASEIKKLEILFKRMGIDHQSLYVLLHDSNSSKRFDDDIDFVIPPSEGPEAIPIPPQPMQPSSRIDFGRLDAIRNETKATASVLAEIFVDDEVSDESILVPEAVVVDEGGMFDGLERRYGYLVAELSARPSWANEDFENLVRAAGLMPGAARQAINDWALDRFDELYIEGDDPAIINGYLLPSSSPYSALSAESMSA